MPVLVPPVLPAGALSSRAQPTLETGGLTLRPWLPSDADAVRAAYADEAVQQWHVRSLVGDEADEWIAARARLWSEDRGADWAVADADVLVGRVGLRGVDLEEAEGEVSYWVVPAARGQAVAPRALGRMSAWLFQDVGFNRLVLEHSTRNAASCRVADKAGYAVEGTLRRQLLHADGWHDMHLHARLSDDG